jgi:ectoine hydroxylase-related dioxygenase (phytanoyl-CoA dioxygenase family)
MITAQIKQKYAKNGYVKLDNFFPASTLSSVKQIVDVFHQTWLKDNQEFYKAKAINSSGLTSDHYLTDEQRLVLFTLICSDKLLEVVRQVIASPAFMGTQLFFDPHNPNQANYWHRDPQYHMTVGEQQQALLGPQVLHVRIPLTVDPGVELIPGSHKKWDNEQELHVRLQQNGHKNSEPLTRGIELPLQLGDVLLFSANMIHRGLYGKNRFALDILYCEPAPQLLEFIQPNSLPNNATIHLFEPSLFPTICTGN